MVLVDTSVWLDHLRAGDPWLSGLLNQRHVLSHPFIIGEIALGNLRQRDIVLNALHALPQVIVASDAEVLHLIERQQLFGLGIGFIDAHLLAAVRLTAGSELWTRDRRLQTVAARLGLARQPRAR